MWQPTLLVLLVAVSLRACTAAANGRGKPLVTPVTKDPSTSLYTAPLNAGRPLVLHLSAPDVTSPYSAGHGQNTRVTLSANATDGSNPLFPVSFSVAASCGAVGVAGLARSARSFPAQVASTQRVTNSFMLCLPGGGDRAGAAIFGGGPFFLAPPADRPAVTMFLSDGVPLRRPFAGDPGYYVSASNGIAVDGARVAVIGGGALIVGFSTTVPYTELRPDVYRPLIAAFDRAMGPNARRVTAAVAPFELCYDSTKLLSTQTGYSVPEVHVMLEGAQNWTAFGDNSMAQVSRGTACFAFVEMKGRDKGAVPAVVIGGLQMESRLVVVDEDKQKLSFSRHLSADGFSCSNFNFTRAA
ncbi:chitinase CLP-like [Aegilops tauschii subsp. strangulata]|uniref:chitinase CLP-like n=1 Tax=Aegilops tauschii subsp. strangulata TaxID=200361 RepID=UPI00098AF67F|nr:chitinase CLP-like [Aegilops tauschii subsp. strangulata]XP_044354437.1 chitinase CLP-like [Triticum aestivum]